MTGVITSIPPLVEQPPGSNASNPAGLAGVTYTAAVPNLPQTWTGIQSFSYGTVLYLGQTSGNTTLNASPIASGVLTLPAATDTLVARNTTDTLTNKTLTTPVINGAITGTMTIPATALPNPSATTLGGIQSLAAVGSRWINTISTSGVPSATQPAFTDISGQATLSQLPTLGANTVLGSIAGGTPIALTTAQHTSLVNTFTTTLSGAVPAPTAVASKFLRDDGTWQTVGGTGTVTNVATAGLATGGPITTTGTVTVTAAVKSDQTTASSTAVAVVPAIQQNHPSACKAWVHFSGATPPVIQASYNVSSVTRSAAGQFVVNFTTAFTSALYVTNVTNEGGVSAAFGGVQGSTRAVGSVGVSFFTISAGSPAFQDPAFGHVACFGTQ